MSCNLNLIKRNRNAKLIILKINPKSSVTTGFFTSTVAKEQNERTINIQFWDGDELLRQIKNSDKIDAFCIQCNKKIKGYYKQFDWKQNVVRILETSVMKRQVNAMKEKLVPKFPKRCDHCEHSYICISCHREFYNRINQSKVYYERLYCYGCYFMRKKRNRSIHIGVLSVISIGLIIGIISIIYLFRTNPSYATIIFTRYLTFCLFYNIGIQVMITYLKLIYE